MNNYEQFIDNKDIIVARATAAGTAALAIIRVSGKGSKAITEKICKPLEEARHVYLRTLTLKNIKEQATVIYYDAGHSYTGEESVEVICHGNENIVNEIINEYVRFGARHAKGGEFTYRAFLNGKLDLNMSEAVNDVITAESIEQINYSEERLQGTAYAEVFEVERLLKDALGGMEAVFHYSDELQGGEEDDALKEVYDKLEDARARLNELLNNYDAGRRIREGVRVAIIGRPNVGKSTLLNAILKCDRAIVTDVAGTTRDTIEEGYFYKGRKFVIIDTAGIRNAKDGAERLGVDRAFKAAEDADVVLNVSDNGEFLTVNNKCVITVMNKCDSQTLPESDDTKESISAKNNINIESLKEKIYKATAGTPSAICNARQLDCAKRCLNAINKALTIPQNQIELVDALCFEAYDSINEMFGKKVSDEIITNVFSRFCVGK